MTPTNVVVFGPTLSGKGTNAGILTKVFQTCAAISTGTVLRAQIDAGTVFGRIAEPVMRQAQLVSNGVTFGALFAEAKKPHVMGATLRVWDGVPREPDQVYLLMALLDVFDFGKVDAILRYDLPDEVVVARVIGRRECPNCGAKFNNATRPPKVVDVCDNCNTELRQRDDDTVENAKTKLRIYREQTVPALQLLREMTGAPLVEIDANRTIAEVGASTIKAVTPFIATNLI